MKWNYKAITILMIFCCMFSCFPICPTAYSTELPSFQIAIEAPEGYQGKKTVNVTITITDENNTGFEKAEVKLGENGKWQDITKLLKEQGTGIYRIVAGVQNNGTVYVAVTDKDGKSYTQNKTIHCFDSTGAVLNAFISGNELIVEVKESLSGIKTIYIGEKSFTELENDRLKITISDYFDDTQKTIPIYAVDNAGNKSETIQVRNPLYETKQESSAPENISSTTKQENISHDFQQMSTPTVSDSSNSILDKIADSTLSAFTSILSENGDTVLTIPAGDATKKPQKEENTDIVLSNPQNTEQTKKEDKKQNSQNTTTEKPEESQQTVPQIQPTSQTPNIIINMPSAPVTSSTPTTAPIITTTETSSSEQKIPETSVSEVKSEEKQEQIFQESVIPTDGTGTVIENSTQSSDTREFFTIQTASGNIFYIVVDKQKQQNNVYLLSAVTENDLLSLVEKEQAAEKEEEKPNQILPQILLPQSKPTKTETENEPEILEEPQPEKKSILPSVILLLLFLGSVFGIAYYFKIYRPKQNDFYEYEDETEAENENKEKEFEEDDEYEQDFPEQEELEEEPEIELESEENTADDMEYGLSEDDYYDEK